MRARGRQKGVAAVACSCLGVGRQFESDGRGLVAIKGGLAAGEGKRDKHSGKPAAWLDMGRALHEAGALLAAAARVAHTCLRCGMCRVWPLVGSCGGAQRT